MWSSSLRNRLGPAIEAAEQRGPTPRVVVGRAAGPGRLSWANRVSIARIALAPLIVASLLYYAPEREGLRLLALGLFVIGMASDGLDGWLARTQNQQTQLGTLLDPLADKCLILGTLISCSVIQGLPDWMRVPAWFNLIVISRDVLLITGTLVLFLVLGRWQVRPTRLGKWTIVSQMLVVPVVLLGLPGKMPLLLLAAALSVLSAIAYVRVGLRVLA